MRERDGKVGQQAVPKHTPMNERDPGPKTRDRLGLVDGPSGDRTPDQGLTQAKPHTYALANGAGALIGGEDALAGRDQGLGGLDELLGVLVLPGVSENGGHGGCLGLGRGCGKSYD